MEAVKHTSSKPAPLETEMWVHPDLHNLSKMADPPWTLTFLICKMAITIPSSQGSLKEKMHISASYIAWYTVRNSKLIIIVLAIKLLSCEGPDLFNIFKICTPKGGIFIDL